MLRSFQFNYLVVLKNFKQKNGNNQICIFLWMYCGEQSQLIEVKLKVEKLGNCCIGLGQR